VPTDYRLGDLAARIGGDVRGDPARTIRAIATLEDAGPDDLAFLTNRRYRSAAERTRAGAILVGPRDAGRAGRDLLVVAEPYAALAELLELFHPAPRARPGVSVDARLGTGVELGRDVAIGPFAVIGDGVVLGARVAIGAGCVVGSGCRIGDDSVLHPRVVLYPETEIGQRVVLHSGAVLGADGFGFATVGGRHRKVPQVGRVVVEDDVEIGANTAIDRAMLGETRIGAGSKIDDLVMVAHGVRVGADSLVAGQAGIAGSARLGARATLAGQAGVAGHLALGEGVVVAAKSAVFEDLPDRAFVAGIPAIDHARWKRAQIELVRLSELRRSLRAVERRVRALEGEDTEGGSR
jgi:UDP-3-O-[3-hydroxymyristoyl] glucosamine N-acyltransferase